MKNIVINRMKNVGKFWASTGRVLVAILFLIVGVGQMWATVTIYAVGNMEKKGGGWVDEKTAMYCHNWGSSATTWPGQSMTKWNDVSVDGHQVWTCNLKADGNTGCIFNNNGGWQTNDITNLNATVKAYPYPTYLNGTWYYSPRVCKALWESDQHAYGGRIYFDNSSASWGDTYMYFVIGHGSYVGYYRITNIGNTKLYYVDLGSQSWGDAKYVAVVGHSSSKSSGSGNPNNLAALTHFSDAYQYSLEYQSTYLVSMSSGANCSQISMDYKSGGYSDFNSTQTINTVVKAAGGSYTSANSKATISITSYEMTGDGAVTKRTPSISTSAKQATVSAARTATTTLSVGDVATGYQFDGWYTAATGGTKLSESTTYTYYPTSATTVYARFSEKTFTVTVTNDGNGTTSPSGAQSNKGQITGVAVSATPSDGYNFNNWTITSGTGSFADATDESTTFYPTSTATIRANFVSAATSTLTVTATTGGSITTPAAGYYSDITTTGYSIAASRSEGYKFTGWTKTAGDGAVSFSDASSLSTTATITTLGDVTVTAGFAAMSNSLSVSSSTLYAGDNITLSATRTNHSLNLTYQYKIGSGSWTDIATQSGTSKTWQIPYANTYQTYKFRVKSTDGSTSFYSAEQTVNVKGRIIIHVKNTNSWASLYLYSWYSSTTTNGAWPGKTGTGLNNQSCSIHATGSQWWDVTITQETATAQKFILNCNTSGDQNKTADLNLSSFTHDAYYAMSTNGSAVQTLSTTTTPSAPTVSTLTAGTIRETSAVLGGNIANAAALGNDIITERGYYWSTNSALSSSNLGVGTKVTISGTQSAAGNFSSTKSSLTAGTKYYFLAYAKNGYGTGYSSVQNFTTLSTYTVTVTAGAGGSASPSSVTAGQYQTSGTITASASTGYTFYNWTKTSGSGTVTFTNANANSTTVKSTSTATVRANFVDQWNLKGDQWSSWDYQPMTATANANEYSKTFTLTKGTKYQFKVVKRTYNGSGVGTTDVWYGNTDNAGNKVFERGESSFTTVANGMNNNLEVTADVTGTYTFTINTSGSTPTITVTYPTAYTITYGVGTINGSSTDISVSPSFTSGDYVLPETDVTFSKGSTNSGYTWKGWYSNVGGTGDAWSTTDASLSLTATRTDNISVYACYNYSTYTVTMTTSDRTGYGSGAPANQTGTYTQAMPTITPPTAANGYCFMGYWDGEEGTGTKYYNANGTSAHAWNKTSGGTLYAYFKKGAISALTLDAAIVAPGTTMGVTPTLDPIPVGDKVICWRVLHGNGNPLDDQPAFSWDGTKVTFPASTNSGTYLAEAILRKGTTCGGEVLDSVTVAFQVAGDHVVTVQYKCGDEFIQTSTTATGRPLAWSEDITAPTIFGYTFARWDAGDGVTIKDGSGEDKTTSTSSTIKIKATYEGKLTAIYTQKQLIYFKNTLGWSDVYVNFYSSEYSWNSTKGSGNQNVTNRNKAMTRIGDTDIWYYDYGYNGGGSSITPSLFVSFTSNSQSNAVNFWLANPGVNVVYPTRYMDALTTDKSSEAGFKAATPMFVPLAGQTATVLNNADNGKANYYNRGYWTKYTPGTGYTLEIYNSAGDVLLKSMEFTSNDELMPMDATVDLEANQTYKFQLRRGGESSAGVYYGNSGTMTYQDHGQGTAWEMTNHPSFSMAGITSSAAGSYTFHLTYSASASGAYRLRMAVDYPVTKGDYRLLYKDNVQTKWFKSAIVPKAENESKVSFFVRKGQSAVLKLQKCTNIANDGTMTWTDTVANLFSGGLPSAITKDSVYVFTFNKAANGKLQLASTAVYDGEYYIRTDCANSKWDNYRSDPDHRMTYSEYSITHGGYSHYYCHWVQTDDRKNVKFCIANDYSPSISDTLTRETASGEWANINSFIDEHGNILRNANVRFMWNQHDNTIKRAYIDGAQGSGSDNYLKMLSSDSKIKDLVGNIKTEVYFQDNENWIYETNIQAMPNARYKLTSNWGTGTVITQYFKGTSSSTETLITGSGEKWYVIRVLYDFKTNRLIAAMLPSGEVDEEREINADVMFIREHQGDIEQLILADEGKISKIETAYGVMRFNKWTINNKDKSTHLPLDAPASIYERSLYWVSFPFRVKLSEVFGFGTYGTHWILQYYDGAARAQYGMWAETGTYWKFIWDRKDFILEPNVGYLLTLETELMGEGSDIWGPNSRSSQVELFFPSYGTMPDITQADVVHNLPSHQCEIDRTSEGLPGGNDYRTTYDRRIVDSHWNVLSVPTYVNTDDVTFASSAWTSTRPKFLYTWNADDNTITATSATGFTFHAMHAYMVQFYGNVTWSAHSGSPYPIVARSTYSEAPKEVEFCLELQQNEKMVDRTYIDLSDDENVSEGFAFNEDMTKEFSGNKPAIYTFIAGDVVAAGNTLPMTEQKTIVPVGIETKTAGDYTIAIPAGTEGIGVTLIDEQTGVRTNLSALDYTINLPAGKHDNRFFLEISPIKTTPTGLEPTSDSSLKGREVRKVLIDQQMYIIKDGKMYDARGNLCK